VKRILWVLLWLPFGAQATDEGRLSFLEQEVRNLQRQVQALSRQLDDMRTRPDRPEGASISSPRAAAVPLEAKWLDAARWRQIRPGMSELEVISLLGPPTSMREERGERLLLYAMEIGSSGFLGGNVALREHAVVRVLQPTLQ